MPVKSPRFALFDLAEGKSYSFRVRCCNSAGVGEASVSTGEITVGDKLGESARPAFILCTGVTVHDITGLLSSRIPSLVNLIPIHYIPFLLTVITYFLSLIFSYKPLS